MLQTAQATAALASAGLANARAGHVGAGGGEKPMTADQAARAIAKESDNAFRDSDTGKVKDPESALAVKSIAAKLREKSKGQLDPVEAVADAKAILEDAKAKANEVVDATVKEAKGKSGFSTSSGYTTESSAIKAATGGLSEKEYRAKAVKDAITRATAALGNATAAPRAAGTAQTADGSAAKVTPASTNTTVGMPSSPPPNVPPAPHKEGTRLRGKDGRNYVVVNGLPQLDTAQAGMR
jgi:hypothetical protein